MEGKAFGLWPVVPGLMILALKASCQIVPGLSDAKFFR